MTALEPACTVRRLAETDPQRAAALRLILSGSTRPAETVERRLDNLEDALTSQGLDLRSLLGAFRGRQLIAAAMTIASPGRNGLVHLSPTGTEAWRAETSIALLRETQRQAWRDDLVLLQGGAGLEEPAVERLYAAAGFRFLAELVYEDRPAGAPVPETNAFVGRFVTYGPATRAAFLEGLALSYLDSLDCPGLSRLRGPEDALASHLVTGRHDPALWFLALVEDSPAGLLLLAPSTYRPVLEVVYMGVAQPFRRRGLAHVLMRQCVTETQRGDYQASTLAVDSANHPARKLYRKWGFHETGRRRVWIASAPSSSPPD